MKNGELMPHAPACLHRGEKKLMPGVYVCAENHLHIVAPELCRAAGYAPTPENIATLSRAAIDVMQKQFPDSSVQGG
jgi:hypothetical protein